MKAIDLIDSFNGFENICPKSDRTKIKKYSLSCESDDDGGDDCDNCDGDGCYGDCPSDK